jgi:hypothetical protein
MKQYMEVNYAKQPLWLTGLGLVILGSIFDFAALGFAPQSVVAPLGSLTLVANVFFAPLLLNETSTRKDMLATFVIISGSVLSVIFSSHEDPTYQIETLFGLFLKVRFLVYGVVVSVYMGVLFWLIKYIDHIHAHSTVGAYQKLLKYHRFAYASLAGTMGAQSVLFAKCCAELLRLTFTGDGVFLAYWETYFVLLGMFGSIYLQIKWLNSGLRLFTALYIVPVFQSFWILISVIGGIVFYGEYKGVFNDFVSSMCFPLGIGLTIVGVYVLTTRVDENSSLGGEATAPTAGVDKDTKTPLLLPAPIPTDLDSYNRFIQKTGGRKIDSKPYEPPRLAASSTVPHLTPVSSSVPIRSYQNTQGGEALHGSKPRGNSLDDSSHTSRGQSASTATRSGRVEGNENEPSASANMSGYGTVTESTGGRHRKQRDSGTNGRRRSTDALFGGTRSDNADIDLDGVGNPIAEDPSED